MRKLATIRTISEIRPIEGADAIECAVVDGWTVVVKKGEFEQGDSAIYCEIDSWIPTELAPFLSKGTEPREYNGVKGERLKTIRLRGQLSQGLLLPTHVAEWKVSPGESFIFEENSDVTDLLGIQKWEAPIAACISGLAKGNFPTAVPKTDQERIQNLKKKFNEWRDRDEVWEVTEKLDGSSCTMYLPLEGDFEVCSRNLSLKKDENNSFWKVAIELDIEQKMRDFGFQGLAIQGELIGEGIQGNPYNLKGHRFFVFDIYDTQSGTYCGSEHRQNIAWMLNLDHCPVIHEELLLENLCSTIEGVLEAAEGKSVLNTKTEREGLVFKNLGNPNVSFKAISNKFLLKGGD